MAGGAPFQLTIDGTDYLGAFAGGSATTPYVIPESLSLSMDADGGGSTFAFEVIQEVTPSSGGTPTPWFLGITDNAVVNFVDTTAGTALSQTIFAGFVGTIEAELNGGGQGTKTQVSCLSSSALLDRMVVWKGKGTVAGVKNAVVSTIKFKRNQTDKVVIQAILSTYVNPRLGSGISNLFDPTITSGISSTTTLNPTAADGDIEIPLGTLRAALDTILELAEARDGKQRRYYIDNRKRLVYGFAGAADSSVTYATAPFKITTEAIDNPAGGTATASTLSVRDITLQLDHDSARKRGFFLAADSNADRDDDPDPYVRTYSQTGIAYPARTGLVTDSLVDVPTVRGSNRGTKLTNAAKAWFGRRRAPIQTISFSVRGAGTATGQSYGFAQGTAQSGTASYTLVDRWAPGQWVQIYAPGLGLTSSTDLFRIEEVSMSFETGSLIRKFQITCDRRQRGLASQLIIGRE